MNTKNFTNFQSSELSLNNQQLNTTTQQLTKMACTQHQPLPMSNYGVLCSIVKPTLESIQDAVSTLYYSSRMIGRDTFDGEIYKRDDETGEIEDFFHGFVKGHSVIFNYPYGTVQFHEKNHILFEYTGLQFIMRENIIPFEMINNFGKPTQERIEMAKVKVKRSNGTIQSALIDLSGGLIIQKEKKRILINLNFYQTETEEDEPIQYKEFTYKTSKSSTLYIDDDGTRLIAQKHVTLNEFFKTNPEFKFMINVENPLKTQENIYKKYVEGNEELEDTYDCLNLYYKFKMQEYLQECQSLLDSFNKTKFDYNVYSHPSDRFLNKIKPEFLKKGRC